MTRSFVIRIFHQILSKVINYRGEQKYLQGFDGKPRKIEPLETSKYRWEDNINMDF